MSNDHIDWLEKSIANEYLNYYKYSDFKNVEQIGSGSYGSVVRANWKNIDGFFALKTFNNDRATLKEVVNEIKLQKELIFHENIVRFYGITKVETEKKYSLVLEYADSGTLKTYLNIHFNELDWNDKYQLSFQLISAVAFLHECDIIHRDLHADNILVHQKKIKLADFGLSKKIAKASSNTSKILGVIPFIDPKHLNDQSYKLNKKSDVYSIGILMWQISSGRQPFSGDNYDVCLVIAIVSGRREEIIDGTPIEYRNLYTECWKYEPNEQDNSLEGYEITSKLSKGTVDLNNELMSNNELNISNISNLRLHQTDVIMNPKINLSNISIQTNLSKISYGSTFDKLNNIVVEKLITVINRKHDKESIYFNQFQQFINQQLSELNQSPDILIKWLSNNQVNPQHTYLLGLFYYYNIGIEENSDETFKLLSQASEENYSIAQVYLGKCYIDGYGIECNKYLAFNWYQKSAVNESIIGQFYLGNCYEFGVGIKKDMIKSVYWYQKAARNGNVTANLYLADCYRLGKGVEKDEIKAFKYYEILAKQEIADAQYQLGNYIFKKHYNKKIKVETNKIKLQKRLSFKVLGQFGLNNFVTKFITNYQEKRFNYDQRVIVNEFKMMPFEFNSCHKKDKGVRKNGREAFEFHKSSAEQGNINSKFQLAYCYDEGIGTDINKVKAFDLYKLIAEKGNNEALYNLSFLYELGEGVDKDEKKAFKIIETLAEKMDLDAIYKLAYYYNKGIGTEINKSRAFELCKKAAKKGNTIAQFNLSLLYELGEGVDKNMKKAFKLSKKLVEEEYLNAQFQLGYYYSKGIGTEEKELIKMRKKHLN
ncbi:kinase-like domain-containing protein [Glomus cerebriforme]|uniref:Kinase-like domain-containing protein n=1 Tax=Glomus cerebriforme TaxID=658196 RepID=A0A397SEJ3_9GLOM|nr:kinase-like domain-containing protein [Glomus cerebriforme]